MGSGRPGQLHLGRLDPATTIKEAPGIEACGGETPPGRHSFRFCRMKGKDLKNCLFMEVRSLFWNRATGKCDRKQGNICTENYVLKFAECPIRGELPSPRKECDPYGK